MKFKNVLLFLFFPVLLFAQEKTITIQDLFSKLENSPTTRNDQLDVERANLGHKMATSQLFPKIGLFGMYDYYTSPYALLPVAPNNLLGMVQHQEVPQPFSDQILRGGASVSMPVFMKAIYTLAAKAKKMKAAAEEKMFVDLQKNKAMLVSINANLQYSEALLKALAQKRESLLKTKEIIHLKVKNDRAPRVALLKIDNGINTIKILQNKLRQKQVEGYSAIAALTGINLKHALPMQQLGLYKKGDFDILSPLRKKIEGEKLAVRSEKEKLLPVLLLHGQVNYSTAKAYNNNADIHEYFGDIGLVLKIPVFNKSQYVAITKSKLSVKKLENELDKKILELTAQAQQLESNLELIKNKINLYKQSIKDKEELLKVAKVAYQSSRMTIEDYLKYEDDLVLEKSKLFQSQAEEWQSLMQLAVLYGTPIDNLVK